MELIIKKQNDSSITKDLSIPIILNGYTVLAGENNAGKTNLIKAIKNHNDIKDYEIIEISAEKNNPEDKETSPSAQKNEFYRIVEKILEPIFKTEIINSLVEGFNNSDTKKEFVSSVNENLKKFGVNKKEFDIKIQKEKFKEEIIIKISKAIVKDLYKTDVKEVDLQNIGMGTQRLIIAALIQYYEKNKISENKKTLIIFEEPEIYLHPKWKESLHKSLMNLSTGNKNIKILITTHDPYFIELNEKQDIYKVFRDSETDSTDIQKIEKFFLDYDSHSERNNLIFGLTTKTYFLELYEKAEEVYLKSTKDESKFDENLSERLNIIRDKDRDPGFGAEKITYLTRIRLDIAHPNTDEKRKLFEETGEKAIYNLKEYISLLSKN